ncbi:MAG: DNA repair protein RecN [Candidatus Merdivicinus sp.]|jgi:DNA repair protein RecN (Recombination protein N)
MLSALYIENLAVIEKTYIEFPVGFSVFTGETGAGKSIIIDAINACLGQRTSREIVRSGTEKACVTAIFRNLPESICQSLKSNGYNLESGELMIERSIHQDGRSNARINGRPAPIGLLREIGGCLVNIHGQHDSQILLSPERHLEILDNFGDLNAELESYQKKFGELRETIRKLKNLTAREENREKRMEYLQFQIHEIEEAHLTPGIEERLTEKSRRYRSIEKIARALENACIALLGDDNEMQGAVDLVTTAKDELELLQDFPEFSDAKDNLENLSLELSDFAAGLYNRLASLEYDQQEADLIEAKLSLINRLKMKYGGTVSEILDYMDDWKKELAMMQSSDQKIRELNQRAIQLKKETAILAHQLTDHRKLAANRLIARVSEEARFLEMPNLQLDAAFTPARLSISGDTAVEFLISTNPGEPPKPISKIASGGELSRIMLAIKSALAEKDQIDTLIFDEIDTGVSGRAAQKIGLKMREIAQNRQILCVTHSAQIAALGHSQFLIQKTVKEDRAHTEVILLDIQGRVKEIARIMATDQVSELAMETAKQMLRNSSQNRKDFKGV